MIQIKVEVLYYIYGYKNKQKILLVASMDICQDSEGWRVVSRIRDFDFTLCFEEGFIISGLLGTLLLSALWRSFVLLLLPSLVRSSKSLWLLRVKLVSLLYPSQTTSFIILQYRHCLRCRSLAASSMSSSYSIPGTLSPSFNPTSLSHVLLLLRSVSPISTILGPGLLHQFFCSSGRCT